MDHKTKSITILSMLFFIMSSSFSISQEKAPDFKLLDLKSKQTELKEYLGKGPVVVDFWASWCKPCVKSLPKLQKIYDKYKKYGLTIIGINQDGPRNRSKINPFIKSQGINFPILFDDNSDVMRRYRIVGLPATVIISPEGNVVKVHKGYRAGDEKLFEEEIISLIKKYYLKKNGKVPKP